jgi:hypothetical protein
MSSWLMRVTVALKRGKEQINEMSTATGETK